MMTDSANLENSKLEEGDIIDGKFRVESVLGVGGMGVVVSAIHLAINQRVALKFMHSTARSDLLQRFQREANSTASLSTDHVAKVLEFGKLGNGSPYIVLEHLSGTDLLAMVEGNGPLPVEYACEYVMQAAVGIADAHSKDIVHRDLTPSNLFLTNKNGRSLIKILDFGIAKAAADVSMTSVGAMLGAPRYIPPEQIRSTMSVDLRADIWSLGATLYHLLTGALPFVQEDLAVLFQAIMSEPPRAFSETGVTVPEGVQKVVLSCLEKDPADRPQSAFELAALLAPFSLVP